MKENNLSRSEDLSCPTCGRLHPLSKINTLRFGGDSTLAIYCCGSCRHRWARTNEAEQKEIEEQYNDNYSGFRTDLYFAQIIRSELQTRFKDHAAQPPAKILDVGCGNGEFLYLAKEAGYACQGIDVSEAAVRLTRSRGVEAVAGDFLTHDFKTRFDIISMWDVAEHLRDPFLFLSRAFELLGEKGVLVLKIPHFGSLNFALLKFMPRRGPLLLGAPDHIQYFSRKSVEELAKRVGFHSEKWFASQGFRSKPPAKTLKKRVSRGLQWSVNRLARNQNFYLFLYKNR